MFFKKTERRPAVTEVRLSDIAFAIHLFRKKILWCAFICSLAGLGIGIAYALNSPDHTVPVVDGLPPVEFGGLDCFDSKARKIQLAADALSVYFREIGRYPVKDDSKAEFSRIRGRFAELESKIAFLAFLRLPFAMAECVKDLITPGLSKSFRIINKYRHNNSFHAVTAARRAMEQAGLCFTILAGLDDALRLMRRGHNVFTPVTSDAAEEINDLNHMIATASKKFAVANEVNIRAGYGLNWSPSDVFVVKIIAGGGKDSFIAKCLACVIIFSGLGVMTSCYMSVYFYCRGDRGHPGCASSLEPR